MGCSDKGEVPPPLPVKGSTADYGNLLDNQDLTSPSTPPPPPPHQRVGVLIRAERSSLMMHGPHNETRGQNTHLTFRSTSSVAVLHLLCRRPVPACMSSHLHLCFYYICVFFGRGGLCVTEECSYHSVSSKGLHPPVHPAVIYTPPPCGRPSAQT